MKKATFLFFCFAALIGSIKAGTIKGTVLDNTGETAIGAVVTLENTNLGAVVGLDGSFVIPNVSKGSYKLHVSMVSYEPTINEAVLNDDKETVTLNIALQQQTKMLKEATIVGHISGVSDANARLLEKKADNVMNILSGRTIELMPDVTVANVLRRVSGVTVDRGDDGEGRYPVVRGMDKRYNYTLVDGIKIPSPDDKNRYVPMDIFPSEMLQRLEVIKALTPDMEGDAIGGAMNLVLKEAPDHLVVQAQGAIGYSQMLFDQTFRSYDHSAVQKQSPEDIHGSDYLASSVDFSKKTFDYKTNSPLPDGQLGLTIGNRFLNDKLGVLFSGMYQSTDRSSNELFFVPNPQPQATYPNPQPELTDLEQRYYSTHEDRMGAHVKLDYKINDKNKISFYTVLMKLNTYQARYMVDSTSGNRFASNGTTPLPGTGEVDIDYRTKITLQSIYNATLQGDHKITDRLSVNWIAAYSEAGQKTPDWTDLSLSHTLSVDTATGKITSTPTTLKSLTYTWQHNLDQDLSGYLNAHYKFNVGKQKFDIGAGGMYRHKDRSNYYIDYTLSPSLVGSPFTNTSDANVVFTPANAQGYYNNNPNNYSVTENITAFYAQVRWQPNEKWNILAGVRNESTYDHYNETTEAITVPQQNGTITYADLLPSAHIKYSLTDNAALHASYFKSISRPSFFEITPYSFPGDYFTEVGNPYLKHSQADNFDLRYELFPGHADQLLIGAFYKKIVNPIENVYYRPAPSEADLMPENLGTATNVGAEIVYTKYFNKFGVSLNYTYTYSNIPTTKEFYYDSTPTSSATIKHLIQNRLLEGQAAHIGNISLLYKDAKKGIDVQLSAIYTGRHIVYVSPYYDMDYWARGTVILDLSGEKKIGKHFAVYAKLNNLLNTPDIVEMMQNSSYVSNEWPVQTRPDRILVEKKYFGQTYLVGLRYNL